MKAHQGGIARRTRCSARSSARSPREDFIPYVADFFLQLEDVKWTVIAGIVNDSLVVSVRNLGYTKNAGEFVRRFFADIGSAGGHRAMAKAVVPMRAFREKFGDLDADGISAEAAGVRHAVPDARAAEKKSKVRNYEVKKSAQLEVRTSTSRVQLLTSQAPDRDPRSGRRHPRGRPTAAASPSSRPPPRSCSSVWPHCDVSTGRLIRLSMPPRLAARLTICSRS